MLVRDLIALLADMPPDAVVIMSMNEEYVDNVRSVDSYFDHRRGVDVVMIDDSVV